ncbi:deoxycytidine triphosphate deaminase [Candidatus Saccharibacteria bacterium]|nr:MAG: deoxycytidine triphosphate deaminase [Candidatus Saccharibacteria bacterium]
MPQVRIEQGRVVPQGGVFSDLEIQAGLEVGHIICEPAPSAINGSSIDVSLGYYFYHAKGNEGGDNLFNPFDEADVRRYYGDYYEAKPWAAVRRKIGNSSVASIEHLANIPDDHPVIVLRPNERILAHTHEFIGILPPGTTSMQARSTTGRIGVSACYCAGWGDPGYVNRWTMEVHNLNENEHVVLPVGYKLAQIVFSSTGPVGTEYALASGNYQDIPSIDLAAIKAAWHPSQMLPKAYKSGFILPTPAKGLSNGFK